MRYSSTEGRKYSEIKAERRATDHELIRRSRIMNEIARLEGEVFARKKRADLEEQIRIIQEYDSDSARKLREEAEELLVMADPKEAERLQCEAEELRCGLYHDQAEHDVAQIKVDTGGRKMVTR